MPIAILRSLLPLLLFLSSASAEAARDPKVDEMFAIQEIAFYLREDSVEILALVQGHSPADPQLRRMIPLLEKLNEKAQEFYERAMKNSKSPWRTVSAYQELDRAFVGASSAFLEQPVYQMDPRLLEEIAYLMGALLGFYTEPIYSITVAGIYPRAVYGWIPTYYNFSKCRFANPRLYPWGKRVNFGPMHR
jgi:hypothetical protein